MVGNKILYGDYGQKDVGMQTSKRALSGLGNPKRLILRNLLGENQVLQLDGDLRSQSQSSLTQQDCINIMQLKKRPKNNPKHKMPLTHLIKSQTQSSLESTKVLASMRASERTIDEIHKVHTDRLAILIEHHSTAKHSTSSLSN